MPSKVEKRGGFEESGPEENERIQYFEGAENPVMMTRFELSRGVQWVEKYKSFKVLQHRVPLRLQDAVVSVWPPGVSFGHFHETAGFSIPTFWLLGSSVSLSFWRILYFLGTWVRGSYKSTRSCKRVLRFLTNFVSCPFFQYRLKCKGTALKLSRFAWSLVGNCLASPPTSSSPPPSSTS